ncbi:MAG: TerC family protein [Deltaproteobacteria bacterium]|nr:TerC family protein [Deltaproteobacteria bacterium]
MDLNLLATFALLVGLEVVLGIDNILLISILTDRLPAEVRNKARMLGLGLALGLRLLLLLGAAYIVKLNEPIVFGLSWKSLILISGGGFLLFKAIKEIHHVVEKTDELSTSGKATATFTGVIAQIVLLDLVFSIDSVITAVGLTDNLYVIYSAVILSFVVVLVFSQGISDFVQKHVTLKILALSFLITIGVTLAIEGLGGEVPKGYIYLPMAFGLGVELLQLRFSHNQERREKKKA